MPFAQTEQPQVQQGMAIGKVPGRVDLLGYGQGMLEVHTVLDPVALDTKAPAGRELLRYAMPGVQVSQRHHVIRMPPHVNPAAPHGRLLEQAREE
jgi:hypothetical protein